MQKPKRYKKTIIIVILVICAMVSRLIARYDVVKGPLNMAVSIVRSGIYIGLILAWGVSIKRRVLRGSVQRYLLAIDGLLLFWMLVRTCKYLFLEGVEPAKSFCWYAFYIPMLCIPLQAIFVAQCLGEPEDYTVPGIFRLLYLPDFFLILMVMTNHYHFFVFDFIGGVAGSDRPYRYGTGYFLILIWMAFEILCFVVLLLKKSHVPGKHKRMIAPLLPLCAGILYSVGYIVRLPILYEIAGDMTAVYLLVIMGVCELCIQSGLIFANEFYEELFQSSRIGAQIVDESYVVRYRSDSAKYYDRQTMENAIEKPVDSGDERLFAAPVHGGYVLWTDDISKIKELLHHLEEAGEKLSEKNELLKAEVSLKEKKAQADEQARLYDKIAVEVKPQLDYLGELLESAQRSKEHMEILAKICVISSYIKRLGNLLLLGEDASCLPARELEYCLQESVENIRLCRVWVSLVCHCEDFLKKEDMLSVYKAFETVVETTMSSLKALVVHAHSKNGSICLEMGVACECAQWEECKEKILKAGIAGSFWEEEKEYKIIVSLQGEVQV